MSGRYPAIFLHNVWKDAPPAPTGVKRKSIEDDDPADSPDAPERATKFYNVKLDSNGEPTKEFSVDKESSAGDAWIRFQFWSRSASERDAYVNGTGQYDPGYKDDMKSWKNPEVKLHYTRELLEYFEENEEKAAKEDDLDEDYNTLLEQKKVTRADIAEHRYLRYRRNANIL